MTLIASFLVCNYPVMLGDAMISRSDLRHDNSEITLPMRGTIKLNAEDLGGLPIALHQKICILHRDLVVAWAGTRAVAKSAIQRIQDQVKDKDIISIDDLNHILTRLNDEFDMSEISLIYQLRAERPDKDIPGDDATVTYYGGGHQEDFEEYGFGQICYAGTGAGILLPLLTESQFPNMPTEPINALGGAMAIVGTLLAREIMDPSAEFLRYFSGGAYELCFYLSRDGFVKIDDVLYAFFEVDIENDTPNLKIAHFAMKANYFHNHLVLQVIEGRPLDGGQELQILRHHVHSIPPIIPSAHPSEASLTLSWKAKYTVSSVLVRKGDLKVFMSALHHHVGDEAPPLDIIMTESSFYMVGSDKMINDLKEGAIRVSNEQP